VFEKVSPGGIIDGYPGVNTLTAHLPNNLASNVLLVNTPQLIVSLCYLFYNSVLTCMLTAHEMTQFAQKRLSVRVTQPRGQQRSTWRLQMPLIYILPLMVVMVLLHWLISRSLYLIRVAIIDNNGVPVPSRDINSIVYSTNALIAALVLGAVLIIVMAGLSFRKLSPGMPVVGSCSVALSAACSAADKPLAAQYPLQYGVLTKKAPSEYGREFVGLSMELVYPLEDGEMYH
jgi:hypothetical protein